MAPAAEDLDAVREIFGRWNAAPNEGNSRNYNQK